MSLFKSIGKAIGGIARVAAPVLSVVNPGLGLAAGALGNLGARTPSSAVMPASLMPASFPIGMGALPQIGRAGAAVVAGAGAVMAGARTVARSANIYCRRHPAWCASIGGLPGVVGLLESGQLPTIRRRRGRGITPRDLRSFRRVASTIRVFCPTVRRIPSRQLHVRRTGISHA